MARVTLALLGPLSVAVRGQMVTSFGYDKVRALLAYLVVEAQRPHARAALAALLWPSEPPGVARKNLRTALATLRQAVGDADSIPPLLLVTRDTVQLNPAADYELDLTAFADLLAAQARHAHRGEVVCGACAALLAQAAELYRGEFLEHIGVAGSVAWEEWALLMRERLHGQMLDTLAQLIAHYEARGEDDPARTYAWRALALEAWNESAHRCLMRVFARAGQRAAALAQYDRCRQVLSADLGIAPAAETTALYERIRAGALERDTNPAAAPLDLGARAPDGPPTAPPAGEFSLAAPSPAARPVADAPGNHSWPDIDRNRARMLAKVRRFWIDGILQQSLHGAALLALGLAYAPTAVEHPWQLALRQPDRPERGIAPGTPIGTVFDALDGALLILGAPGSGKTTTLLQLAADLLDRAEHNPDLPIPVVFSLSSWAAQRRPLADWLVDELQARYQVPRRIGRAWVDAAQILPLLDGLDEVALEQRAACVETINAFRARHWLLNLVVCSRSADYDGLAARLQLHGAVTVQPLAPEQVDAYLAQGGEQLGALRALLREDAALRELADTPLILTILALAYHNQPIDALRAQEALDERRELLFDAYIQRMFERRASSTPDAPRQTIARLTWLARAMAQRSQSIFFIEGLQPDWLETKLQRRLYAGGTGLAISLVVGVFALLANLLSLVIHGGLSGALGRLGTLLLVAAGSAVCASLLGMVLYLVQLALPGRRRWLERAMHVGWLGASFALIYGTTGWAAVGRDQSIPAFVALGIAGVTVGLLTEPGRIVGIERYRWSWAKARSRWHLIGACALLVSIIYTLMDGAPIGVIFGLASIIVPGLVFGLASSEIETKTLPNQGIWQSAWNAAQIGAACGLVSFLMVTPLDSWLKGAAVGMAQGAGTATVGLLFGGLIAGGFACIQHVVLRATLWQSDAIPWNYARFLDDAAALLLLRKVGGGYIFAHRLLLEHFAAPDRAGAKAGAAVRAMVPDLPQPALPHAMAAEQAGLESTLVALRPRSRVELSHVALGRAAPAPPAPLIGRDQELALLRARLLEAEVRLLTLVGPPGVGKTRLALETLRTLGDAFADGACLVELAPIRDPALVGAAIAQALGVWDVGARPLADLLTSYLRHKRLLLVLDNCEHVLDAAPLAAELLAACPGLKVLATSRAPLHIRAERQLPVPPLGLPAPERLTLASASQAPAVALFVERVQAAQPNFMLTDTNASVVAAICARLDGLPLAIELAATRGAELPAAALLAQLDRRLEVLTGGPRDLPAHQQALRTTLAWSYDRLAPRAQAIFAALGVFAGGCDQAALGAVCARRERVQGGHDLETNHAALDESLHALVDQHLLLWSVTPQSGDRFTMLETIREYAVERLIDRAELDLLRGAHARHYLALAEQAHAGLEGPSVQLWLARLAQERDNLDAALRWCGEDAARATLGCQLAGALWPYWQLRSQFAEGRAWLAAFLAPALEDQPASAARAHLGAGWLAYYQDDYDAAAAAGAAGLLLFRRIGDAAGQAGALNLLGFCLAARGDYTGAVARITESVALSRAAKAAYQLALALLNLGFLYADQEDNARAQAQIAESLEWASRIQHPVITTRALNGLGELARLRGDYRRAEVYYLQSLQLYQQLGDRRGVATLQHNLGCVDVYHGQLDQARARFRHSLGGYGGLDDASGMAASLAGLALVIARLGGWERGVELLSAAYAARAAIQVPIIVPDRYDYERGLEAMRANLEQATFDAAWARGQALPLERALEKT